MAAAAGRALRRHKLLTHKKLQSSVVGSLKQGFCVVCTVRYINCLFI